MESRMKIPKDQLETYFEYGVDIVNRCIFLTGDIEEENISHVLKGLYLMEKQNSAHDPIELRISSYGGSIYDMYSLHDTTRILQSPVYTIGIGKVMSAAVLLIASGEQGNRWSGPHTSFMIHVPSWESDNQKLHDHKVSLKESERLWEQWYQLMSQYTKRDVAFWKKLCNKRDDVYFDAYQAQEWGIIDDIWDEKDGE